VLYKSTTLLTLLYFIKRFLTFLKKHSHWTVQVDWNAKPVFKASDLGPLHLGPVCPCRDPTSYIPVTRETDAVRRNVLKSVCLCVYQFTQRLASERQQLLPRDAMHMRGRCRHAVSDWVYVCLSRSCIVSKRLKMRPKLPLNANRKPYQGFQMVLFPMPSVRDP